MKKTKLLISIAALALVVSLGACEVNVGDDSTTEDSSEDQTSSETSSEGDTTEETTSGDNESTGPVADLLLDIAENNNFTLTIEYYDWYSNYYENETTMLEDYYGGSMSVNGHDYFIDITATKDALLLEYYINYSEWLEGKAIDIEFYVNTDSGLQIYYVSYSYDTNLYLYSTVEGFTWQTYLCTPIDLADYSSRFIEGETTTGNYGQQTSYTIDLDFSFLSTLVKCLFTSGNYFPDYDYSYFIYYYTSYYYYYGALPTTSSTYYVDDGEWDVGAYYFWEWYYEDASSTTGYLYQLEFDSVYTYLYDVGGSVIPEAYSSYLN